MSSIQPLEPSFGNQLTYFAQQKDVVPMVSGGGEMMSKCFFFISSSCERLFATGIVTSPNYPDNHPNNFRKTETIQVEQGLILSLKFTTFNIEIPSPHDSNWCSGCDCNYLTITEGDGTIIMGKMCGSTENGDIEISGQNWGFSLPPNITSRSNVVKLIFTTTMWSSNTTKRGWSLSWSAVAPGECQKNV